MRLMKVPANRSEYLLSLFIVITFTAILTIIVHIALLNAKSKSPSPATQTSALTKEVKITMDAVHVNNTPALISDNNEVFVTKDDAVKISGTGTAGNDITVEINSRKITTKIDNNGNWFVLFSITNMNEASYTATATSGDQAATLVTIIVGHGIKTF